MKDKRLMICFMSIFVLFAVIWGAEISKRNKQIYELDKQVKYLSSQTKEITEAHDDEIYHLTRNVNSLSAVQKKLTESQEEQNRDFQSKIDEVNGKVDKIAAEGTEKEAAKFESTEAVKPDVGTEVAAGAAPAKVENGSTTEETEETVTTVGETVQSSGGCLTPTGGIFWYGNQLETYYNLDMSAIVETAHSNGIGGEYWIRDDGCKMLGDYIMLACNRDIHPYGSLVETSLGTGISLDTGGFAAGNPYQVDIATNW